ncbi:hypothetical protein FH120_01650 [Staphylococcus hominis]|uniref:hypothetical protein n=1 Tax=Staphylococcus hominis TaxID=1290 RepID=UPI001F57D777|nr:hypothetical protein [Staphylococcus hominis]MCI2870621.1 hypothetical protein [Staphylococcus hominis]MCI2874889.1 hypothetical protein [Staphylococcus hominis]
MGSVFAIEYFIKRNDDKTIKMKMYETHRKGRLILLQVNHSIKIEKLRLIPISKYKDFDYKNCSLDTMEKHRFTL